MNPQDPNVVRVELVAEALVSKIIYCRLLCRFVFGMLVCERLMASLATRCSSTEFARYSIGKFASG